MEAIESKRNSSSPMPERLAFLDSLRAIAMAMVVGIHTFGYCVALPPDLKSVLSFIVQNISVAVFFLADGYLFARSTSRSATFSYPKYVQRSFFRLMIPWAIFTVVYTVARYLFERTGFLEDHLIVGHPFREVALSAVDSLYAPQMYFLFSLFLIRLCSPLFRRLVSVKSGLVLFVVFVCYVAAYRAGFASLAPYLKIAGGESPFLHAVRGMQFYMLGAVCFKVSETRDLRKLFAPFLLLFVAAILLKSRLSENFMFVVQYLYLITLFLFSMFLVRGFSLLHDIGRNTMGIYLIHTPIVMKAVSLVLNRFVSDPLASFLSVLFVTLAVTIVIVKIISAIPYGSLLFGTPYRGKLAASGAAEGLHR